MFQLLAAYSAATSSSSSYLIILIIIIIFLGSSSNNIFFHFSTTASTTLQLNCYDYAAGDNQFSCENVNYFMKYPFWSMDELQDQQQQHCGYPGLGITCSPNNDKPPIINISNQSFYVMENGISLGRLFYDDFQRLTIVDPDFVETTCPRPRRNFTTNQDFSDDWLLSSNNEELTFFLNCSTSPPPPQILTGDYWGVNRSHHLKCLDYNDTLSSYAFFNGELDYYSMVSRKLLDDWNRNYCKESMIVQAGSSNSDAIIGYMQILQRGLQVSWSTPIECRRCESSGGFCSFSTTYGKQKPISYKCWCKDERQLRHSTDGRQYWFRVLFPSHPFYRIHICADLEEI